jgi:single-strand DNA-binding protein
MASYNRVILMGNLTRDPQLRYTGTGVAVCDFGLAVNNRKKAPSGEWVDDPVFVDITLWERQAETAGEYLTKGAPVLIEGHLKFDTWEGQDGQKRSKLTVVGDRMQLLGGRGAPGDGGGPPPGPRPAPRAAAPRGNQYSQPAQYSQAGPPDDAFEAPPADNGGGGGGGDDIPF